jgi:hypothetical protein
VIGVKFIVIFGVRHIEGALHGSGLARRPEEKEAILEMGQVHDDWRSSVVVLNHERPKKSLTFRLIAD